ncbi:hypothetical protein JTB14_036892 [Gonioctena quinquepunctata]|nr:hypothetical protein JTB14_036892 [Gonioctena quinquepunctata]
MQANVAPDASRLNRSENEELENTVTQQEDDSTIENVSTKKNSNSGSSQENFDSGKEGQPSEDQKSGVVGFIDPNITNIPSKETEEAKIQHFIFAKPKMTAQNTGTDVENRENNEEDKETHINKEKIVLQWKEEGQKYTIMSKLKLMTKQLKYSTNRRKFPLQWFYKKCILKPLITFEMEYLKEAQLNKPITNKKFKPLPIIITEPLALDTAMNKAINGQLQGHYYKHNRKSMIIQTKSMEDENKISTI